MTQGEARLILREAESSLLDAAEAAATLAYAKDVSFQDLLLCLTSSGGAAELGALTLYTKTRRQLRQEGISGISRDRDDWESYLKENGFL